MNSVQPIVTAVRSVVPASAEAQEEPPARKALQGLGHLRDDWRMTVGQAEHRRRDQHAGGRRGEPREQRPRLERGLRPDEMVAHRQEVEPQRFGVARVGEPGDVARIL